jgi:hypothetical protein
MAGYSYLFPREEVGMISGASKVVIEVEDQERAKVFWSGTMGFEVAQDAPYEERWLEVRPPNQAGNLVLDLCGEGASGGNGGAANLERDIPLRRPAGHLRRDVRRA